MIYRRGNNGFKQLSWLILVLGILLYSGIGLISASMIIFEDDFDRANNETVGNSWEEIPIPTVITPVSANISNNMVILNDSSSGGWIVLRKNFTGSVNINQLSFSFRPQSPDNFQHVLSMNVLNESGTIGIRIGIVTSTNITRLYNPDDTFQEVLTLFDNEFYIFNITNIDYEYHNFSFSVRNSTGYQANVTGVFYRNVSLDRFDIATGELSHNNDSFDNFSIHTDLLTENSQTFNSTTREGDTESFNLNLTYDNDTFTNIQANLNYNGTSYSGTNTGSGGEANFTSTINIPILPSDNSQNRTFYWEIILTNSSGSTGRINSSEQTQEVTPIIFTICNATYTDVVVNYTIYEEDNQTSINSSFDATFNFSINGSEVYKNYSFSSPANNDTFQFCSNINDSLSVDAIINLYASGYDERTYFLESQIYSNDSKTEKFLYLLGSGASSIIIVEVKDQGLQPLQGYFVDIERYYPENNSFIKVISEETDEFGQFVASLIQNTVKYRFIFKNPSGTILKTTDKITIACRTTICIMPFVIEDTEDDFDRFDNVTDFTSSLSFDNTTNIFTVTWNDLTGDSVTYRLFVERVLINGTATVCDTSSTSSSDSLTCNVGGSNANYRAQFYRQVTGEDERRISVLNIRVGTTFETYGKEGLIWAFLVVFTLFAVGSFNPTVGAILYFVSTIMLGIIGIISFSAIILIANLILVVLFVWAFRS